MLGFAFFWNVIAIMNEPRVYHGCINIIVNSNDNDDNNIIYPQNITQFKYSTLCLSRIIFRVAEWSRKKLYIKHFLYLRIWSCVKCFGNKSRILLERKGQKGD